MFSIIRESLKFNKLPSKRASQLFLTVLFLAFFLFYQFPLGDPQIKALDKLMELDWQQLVNVLQQLISQKQLLNLLSPANILYYVSSFVFNILLLLASILFLSWQTATYKHERWQQVIKRFFSKQLSIWVFLFLLMLTVVAFSRIFNLFPTIAIALSLFAITQALFVPTLLIDYNYRLSQAFYVSRQIMQGFKLNFLLTFVSCHFLFRAIPELVLLYLLPVGPLLNVALALSKAIYTLICLRCLFVYYFYLSEYFYPQIRILGLLDLDKFFSKLNQFVYPLHTEREQAQLQASLKQDFGLRHDLEHFLFKQELQEFKADVLQKELPIDKPIDKLLSDQAQAERSKQAESAEASPNANPATEASQNLEEKAELLQKNLLFIQAKLSTALAQAGLSVSKPVYLQQAAEQVASDFYRSKQQLSDLEKLLLKQTDYLKRAGRTVALVAEPTPATLAGADLTDEEGIN